MKGSHRLAVTLVLLFGLSAGAMADAARVWDQTEALQASVTGPTTQWRTRLGQAVDISPELIRETLEALLKDDALSLPARERTLYDFAVSLRLVSDTEAGRAALDWLQAYESQVLVPDPEGGLQRPIPLYRVSTAALGTRNAWRFAAARAQTLESIQNKDRQVFDHVKVSDVTARRGAVAAFRDASPEALAALRDELLMRTKTDAAVAAVTAIAARRLNDMELFQAVLASSDQEAGLSLLPEVVDRFEAQAAFETLRVGLANEPLASASLLQMARLHNRVPAADELLFASLADRKLGGSAAAALAQTRDPEIVDRVDALLVESSDRWLQARAVLALQLEGSEGAVNALKRFGERDDVDTQLRREVNQWLAR